MSECVGEGKAGGCRKVIRGRSGCSSCVVIFTIVFSISGVLGVRQLSWVVGGASRLQFREIREHLRFMDMSENR